MFVIFDVSGKFTTDSMFNRFICKWEPLFTMSIGKRIEAVRKQAGLPQQAFADHLGFSRRTLHVWEKDQSPPPVAALIKIREIFDVDPEWVIMGDGLTPRRHFQTINWDAYDKIYREIEKIAAEVRLVLSSEQIERLARLEFADGTQLTGKDRSRLTEYLRTFSLER